MTSPPDLTGDWIDALMGCDDTRALRSTLVGLIARHCSSDWVRCWKRSPGDSTWIPEHAWGSAVPPHLEGALDAALAGPAGADLPGCLFLADSDLAVAADCWAPDEHTDAIQSLFTLALAIESALPAPVETPAPLRPGDRVAPQGSLAALLSAHVELSPELAHRLGDLRAWAKADHTSQDGTEQLRGDHGRALHLALRSCSGNELDIRITGCGADTNDAEVELLRLARLVDPEARLAEHSDGTKTLRLRELT